MSPSLFKQDSPDGQGAVRPESRERIPVEPIEKSRRRRREEPGSISVLGVGIEVTGEITGCEWLLS